MGYKKFTASDKTNMRKGENHESISFIKDRRFGLWSSERHLFHGCRPHSLHDNVFEDREKKGVGISRARVTVEA